MAISIPGLSLSILRQQTSVQSGLPLLVSGRFTAFGLGVPAFIRVFLEGPSYDPQIRSFDTFSSPFSGDYAVNVIAEKDGQYDVYARSFPPPIIPTGPPFPDAMLLMPAMAESTRPPLVVGIPFNGGVEAWLPDGTKQRLDAPAQLPIEFRPVISVGAPGVSVSIPGFGGAPGVPTLPWYPGEIPAAPAAPTPSVPAIPGLTTARAVIDDVLFSPEQINPGMEATGTMAWRNTGDAPQLFDLAFYLVTPDGVRYGPLQVNQDISANPQSPTIQRVRLNTEGMPSAVYSVVAEVYDVITGTLLTARTLPSRLLIRDIVAPEIPLPPIPEIPSPVVPVVPTLDVLGTPSLNLPSQINVGDPWQGSVSLPTFGPVPFFGESRLLIRDPFGAEQIVAQGGRTIQPGEILKIPVDFDTSGFAGGNYPISLLVFDQMGTKIAEFPMGFLSMLEAFVPGAPQLPALPTADMFGTPSVNLPSQIEIGELWQGDINIPTMAPPALIGLPAMPSLPVDLGLQLQNPAGQLFTIGSWRPTFSPGQPINLPINFDTSALPQEGFHNLVMSIKDLQGNTLFSNIIGSLQALLPEGLPGIPGLPGDLIPSRFPSVNVNLGPSEVDWGDSLDIPVTFTHEGAPEEVTLYAAIGNWGFAGFDEILHASKTVAVGLDPGAKTYRDSLRIPITMSIRPGYYDVYAKITGRRQIGPFPFGESISPPVEQVVRVLGPEVPEIPAPPAPPAISRFTSIRVNISPQQVEAGDQLRVPVSIIHIGGAEEVTLYAAIGNWGFAGFDEVLQGSERISAPLDQQPTARGEDVIIPITSALRPGKYDVYAKITGKIPETVSDPVQNVIEVVGAPEVPLSQFPSCSVDVSRQTLDVGATLTVPVRFVHYGKTENIRVYAAIGNWGSFGFDEILQGQTELVVPDDMTTQTRTVNISISITSALRPGQYDVYGKVMRVHTGLGEIVSSPLQNVITIAAPVPVGPSVFSQVTVAYPTGPVRIGSSASLRVNFMHAGEGESEWLYAAIGTAGAFGFDEILSNRRAITVPAEPATTFHSETIEIPITAQIRPGVYDVYAKIGLVAQPRAISRTTEDVIQVVS